MYTLDTNAIIYFFKGDERASSFLRDVLVQNQIVYVSTITELELLSFSQLQAEELSYIEDLLKTVTIISLDSRLARIAADLRRNYHIKTADSVVAATALMTGSALITRNTRDFRSISALSLIKI